MLCNSRTDFTDVNLYVNNTVFTQAYGIEKLPWESTLRQRMDEFPIKCIHEVLRKVNEVLLMGCKFGTLRVGELSSETREGKNVALVISS